MMRKGWVDPEGVRSFFLNAEVVKIRDPAYLDVTNVSVGDAVSLILGRVEGLHLLGLAEGPTSEE